MFPQISDKGLIVILNGTSCAGKSTLSRSIKTGLNDKFSFIECDAIEDELKKKKILEPEKKARALSIEKAKNIATKGRDVILDMIVSDPEELASLDKKKLLLILVYAPPEALIARDNQRTLTNQNPLPEQATKRGFILQSFCNLYQPTTVQQSSLDNFNLGEIKLDIDGATDSMHYLKESIAEFEQKFSGKGPVFIMPRYKHDIVINTTHLKSASYISLLLSEIVRPADLLLKDKDLDGLKNSF